VRAQINYSEHVYVYCLLKSQTYSSYAILGNRTHFCPVFPSPFALVHSEVSCKFLILLKLLLKLQINSPPFMFVSCTNQDTGFLLPQCVWVLVFMRQEEEMSLWHENVMLFFPPWEKSWFWKQLWPWSYEVQHGPLTHSSSTIQKLSFPPKWQKKCGCKQRHH